MTGQYTVITMEEIRARGWITPGQCIGETDRGEGDHFSERLREYHSEFRRLTIESRRLEGCIAEHIARLLEEREEQGKRSV